MTVTFNGREVALDGKTLEMEVRVLKVRQHDDLILVLLDDQAYGRNDPNAERNVVALDSKGRQVWRIQKTPSAPLNDDGTPAWNAYVGVAVGKERSPIEGYDWTGRCWKVDPETGEVSDPIFTR